MSLHGCQYCPAIVTGSAGAPVSGDAVASGATHDAADCAEHPVTQNIATPTAAILTNHRDAINDDTLT